MSIKKCVNGSFVNDFYKEYGTDTDTITSLPKTIIGDGQPISSYTIKGNMTQSGTPTPSNPVYPTEVGEKTANLWNPNQTITRGYYNDSGTLVDDLTTGHSELMSISGNSTFTINNLWYNEEIKPNFAVYEWDSNKQFLRRTNRQYPTDNPITFTTGNDAVYISFQFKLNWNSNGVMLNTGQTALPYEPYGYKIPILSNGTTYPVYLAEPIRKISTYADECPSTGTASRIDKKLVFDGTEEGWRRSSSYSGSFYCGQSITGILGTTIEAYCSHAVFTPIISAQEYTQGKFAIDGSSSAKTFNIYYDNGAITLADFKQWVADQYAAGTPLTVWYVLATAETESFTAPSIPTSGTAQSFDVDTTLKPSEVSLTYHGWHEHEDTKFTT